MKTTSKILLILFILAIPLVALILKPQQETFTILYDVHFDEEGGGFNADNDRVYFGTFNKNLVSHAWRPFFLTNNKETNVNVEILIDGPLKNNIWISENPILLLPGENKSLRIDFYADPGEFEVGHYEGNVKAVYTQIR